MRALVWDGRKLALDAMHAEPQPSRGQALVRVRLAGICSTDLQILRGYLGFTGIPGHEFVGEVQAGSDALVGRRVVGEINFACGECEYCARGLGRHCPRRRTMGIAGADGCFADLVLVPETNLHLVPEVVEDEEAVFTEPLAAAFEILEQVRVGAEHEVTVVGDGKLGLLCAQVLAQTGARVHLVGKHEPKLAFARSLGIAAGDVSDGLPPRADIVVEATGSASGLELALGLVRARGILVLKSTIAEEHRLSLARVVIDEITVVGSRCGVFPPALEALRRRSLSLQPLVERVHSLSDGVAALAEAARPGALKVLLDCR
jgi:threonine dehydrogenase-like Zn-dependent dehydrogenase